MNRQLMLSHAPAIFTRHPDPRASNLYKFVSTIDAIEALEQHGYEVIGVQQRQVRSYNPAYARHSVAMRHTSLGHSNLEAVPQLVLVNGHDLKTKLEIKFGIYRFACANEVVVGKSLMLSKSKHVGSIDGFLSMFYEYTGKINEVMSLIDRWRSIQLNEDAVKEYDHLALELRFGKKYWNRMDQLRMPEAKRDADVGNGLWVVYNRVHENLIRGGIGYYDSRGRSMVTRPVLALDSSIKLNERLWDMTAEFAERV